MMHFFYQTRPLLVGLLLAAGSLAAHCRAEAQSFTARWAQQIGGPDIDQTFAVTVDAQHNSYVTGMVRGRAQVGPTPVTARAVAVYTAKYDAGGALAWVRTATAPRSYSTGRALATDAAGNVYVAGAFTDTLAFGSTTLYGSGTPGFFTQEGFMAKYNAQGDLQWARRLSQYSDCYALALDAGGSIYVAGNGSSVLSKFDAQGSLLWEQEVIRQTGNLEGNSLAVDGSGAVWLAATLGGRIQLNGQPRTPVGTTDAVLIRFSPQGSVQSWRQLGQSGSTQVRSVAVAPDGTVYFSGSITNGAATFGGTTLPGPGYANLYVGSCDAAGNPRWIQPISGTTRADIGFSSLALDAAGNVCVAGVYSGALRFGSSSLPNTGSAELFMGRYDAQGSLRSVQRAGSLNSNSLVQGLAVGSDNDWYICGELQDNATLGGLAVSGRGWHDGFVARFSNRPLSSAGASPLLSFSAYPNPAPDGRLRVVLGQPSPAPGRLRLLNALGQVVHTQALAAGSTRADVGTAGLARGRYALQLVSGEAVSTQAVIIP
jgi:hypothetical protein